MNFNIGNIILGSIGIALGILVTKEAYNLNHHFYFLDFVEQKFGGGSGTKAYRIVGILICIFSIFVILGIIDPNARNINNINSSNSTKPVQSAPRNNNGIIIAP